MSALTQIVVLTDVDGDEFPVVVSAFLTLEQAEATARRYARKAIAVGAYRPRGDLAFDRIEAHGVAQ